ncbi:Reticulon-like protein [Melia azedarach]|uniref:Reticulon-like protein n=1 Tax=Melia azedarach TaxID=155640 RepID=A0ACC1Y8H4_MELAZ|nr:Reticulon-like protein [Melia azedarach]
MLQPVDGTADDSANSLKTHDENNGSSENASGIDKNHTEKEKEDEGFIDNVKKNHRFRLLGREKPIHHVLGGGKSADIILWKNKNISAGIFAGGTVIWLLFECIGYHLITFISHSIILTLSVLFLWSNLAAFNDMSPPQFPEIKIPQDLFVKVAMWLRNQFNWAAQAFRDVVSKQDLKKFLSATFVLWVISVVGSWFTLLTLLYLVFVMFLTLPMLYEKHEDHVDNIAEKAFFELKKQYSVLDETVLQKLPISCLKKQHQS